MRVRVVFHTVGDAVLLPWDYQHHLQGMLYTLLIEECPELDELLHQEGVAWGPKRFRMLTFSKLYPLRAVPSDGGLLMRPPLRWWVATALSVVGEVLVGTLLKTAEVRVAGKPLFVASVEVESLPPFEADGALYETMGPLVVSRPEKRDGKLRHMYLSPDQEEFWNRLARNLQAKAEALGIGAKGGGVAFEPFGNWRSRLVRIQGAKVRGFEGRFRAWGDPALLELAYNAGLGERNGQGFGMIHQVGWKPSFSVPRLHPPLRQARRAAREI